MSSVTGRIKEIKQPYGGYVKPSQFAIYKMDDGHVLYEKESVKAGIVGLAVDYLTRYAMGADRFDAFKISCIGATMAEELGRKGAIYHAADLLLGMKGINKKTIINACKLASYDVWYRNPYAAITAKRPSIPKPNRATIKNIKIMLQRSRRFWDSYGPIVADGFSFEPYGYTQTVHAGDGDFLTADTLWDFKVSKYRPTSKHTLQLLMYWIMGQHSGQAVFRPIHKLGIFNPRLNEVYLLDINQIPGEVIAEVESNVICY